MDPVSSPPSVQTVRSFILWKSILEVVWRVLVNTRSHSRVLGSVSSVIPSNVGERSRRGVWSVLRVFFLSPTLPSPSEGTPRRTSILHLWRRFFGTSDRTLKERNSRFRNSLILSVVFDKGDPMYTSGWPTLSPSFDWTWVWMTPCPRVSFEVWVLDHYASDGLWLLLGPIVSCCSVGELVSGTSHSSYSSDGDQLRETESFWDSVWDRLHVRVSLQFYSEVHWYHCCFKTLSIIYSNFSTFYV